MIKEIDLEFLTRVPTYTINQLVKQVCDKSYLYLILCYIYNLIYDTEQNRFNDRLTKIPIIDLLEIIIVRAVFVL